jgi:nucleoside-diphosphate-sugar epimerase
MRVVVVGATGNIGTSLVASLVKDPNVREIVGVARRPPGAVLAKTRHVALDVTKDDLTPHLQGAAAVVALSWRLRPERHEEELERVNVEGNRRIFEAVVRARVPALVVSSSVGAYAEGPKDRFVDESWPTTGIVTSLYGRQKAKVERLLDDLEQREPWLRVVRLRPALVFKRQAASEIKALFIGRLLPSLFLSPRLVPFVPDMARLRFQAVHSLDVGEAFRLAVLRDVRGAFNIAAPPVLDPETLAHTLNARRLPVPRALARALVSATYHLRLQPTNAGWLDMALGVPLLDTTRARDTLGWEPHLSATQALLELMEGMRHGAGTVTAPLAPTGGRG